MDPECGRGKVVTDLPDPRRDQGNYCTIGPGPLGSFPFRDRVLTLYTSSGRREWYPPPDPLKPLFTRRRHDVARTYKDLTFTSFVDSDSLFP